MSDYPDSFELAGVGEFRHDPDHWEGYYRGPTFDIPALRQPVSFALSHWPLDDGGSDLVVSAVANLRAASSALRDEIAHYLVAYYRRVRSEFSDEECTDYGIPLHVDTADVWEHINFKNPATVEPSLVDRNGLMHADVAYIDFEASCSWEIEHGTRQQPSHHDCHTLVEGFLSSASGGGVV